MTTYNEHLLHTECIQQTHKSIGLDFEVIPSQLYLNSWEESRNIYN